MTQTSTQKRPQLLALATVVSLSGIVLAATPASAAPAPATASANVPTAATKSVAGNQIHVKVKGKTLGRKAKVKIKGVAGSAKGFKKTLKVKKNKTKKIRSLKAGTYRITANKIKKGGTKAVGRVKPRKVKVTQSSGAYVPIRYRKASVSNSSAVSGPKNLRIDKVRINGKQHIRGRWDAATGKKVKTYRAHYSLSSAKGPWSHQDPPNPLTATSFSYPVCSDYPWLSISGWGYITAVFTDGTESKPSNKIYYALNC